MSEETKRRIFVSSEDRITAGENHLVTLTLQSGEQYEKLEPRRLFPVSRLDSYITLLDPSGKEIAVIRSLKELDKASLSVVENSLRDYYLVPNILAIHSVVEKYGTIHWCVETDRGIKEFDIRVRLHDVRVYESGEVRIRDSNDNRYVVPDYRKLDARSRSFLTPDL